MTEFQWREALYRQMARQPGIPAGLRPELIKRAEGCISRARQSPPAYYAPPQDVQGCKGAISR